MAQTQLVQCIRNQSRTAISRVLLRFVHFLVKTSCRLVQMRPDGCVWQYAVPVLLLCVVLPAGITFARRFSQTV